jgi:hypothetical protein
MVEIEPNNTPSFFGKQVGSISPTTAYFQDLFACNVRQCISIGS